jgi:hypothetical protein
MKEKMKANLDSLHERMIAHQEHMSAKIHTYVADMEDWLRELKAMDLETTKEEAEVGVEQ